MPVIPNVGVPPPTGAARRARPDSPSGSMGGATTITETP